MTGERVGIHENVVTFGLISLIGTATTNYIFSDWNKQTTFCPLGSAVFVLSRVLDQKALIFSLSLHSSNSFALLPYVLPLL